MLTARDSNGKRIPVFNKDGTKNHEGFCPCCGKSLNARAGEIRRPHWAHTSVERCDEWWENEEEWHYEWRKLIDITEHSCEVDIENVLEKDNVRHFYDARINNRLSIILRRGKLSEDQIQQYESFFGDMLWIVEAKKSNITRFHRMKDSGVIREIAKRRGCYSMRRGETGFYEKWAKCKAPVVLDFGENEKNEKNLWVILPNNDERVFRYIINFSKKELLDRILKEGNLFRNGKTLDDVLKDFDEKIKEIDCEFTEFGNGRRRRSSNQDDYLQGSGASESNGCVVSFSNDMEQDDISDIDYDYPIDIGVTEMGSTLIKSCDSKTRDGHNTNYNKVFADNDKLANYWKDKRS